jgi:hypothetical protein
MLNKIGVWEDLKQTKHSSEMVAGHWTQTGSDGRVYFPPIFPLSTSQTTSVQSEYTETNARLSKDQLSAVGAGFEMLISLDKSSNILIQRGIVRKLHTSMTLRSQPAAKKLPSLLKDMARQG